MRAASSEASGSSINSSRGFAKSARPIATRCFSPPESRPGRRVEQGARCRAARRRRRAAAGAGAARREPAAEQQVLPHASDAGTGGLPETHSRCGGDAPARRRRARCRARPSPSTTMRPRSRSKQPGDRVDDRGLAGAGAAEQRGQAAAALEPRRRARRRRADARSRPRAPRSIAGKAAAKLPRQQLGGEQAPAATAAARPTVRRSAAGSPPGTWVSV